MQYDVLIIGAGTSGSMLARRLAKRGHSVLLIDRLSREKIGTKYDIFHIEEKEFARFDIPRPVRGDPAWAFEFEKNYTADPENRYPVLAINPIVGLHMHEYTALLNDLAAEAGAKLEYEACFTELLYNADGTIGGARYKQGGKEKTAEARVTVDCSGMFTKVRTSLPAGECIENFALSDEDMFYVLLHYVKLDRPEDYLDGSCGWPFFKSWIAPCEDPTGAIVGIGACHSYDYAAEMYQKMLGHITLPPHTEIRTERGCTPFTRPPYSFVTDRFVVSGDAACLTKPMNGEGVTSSMAHLAITANVLDRRLRTDNLSKEALWEINWRYNAAQGADFASTRALLTGVVNAASFGEFMFAFESGLISDDLMAAMNAGPELKLSPVFLAKAAATLGAGILTGKVSRATVKAAGAALKNAGDLKNLYLRFPKTPEGYADWCKTADALWEKVGKIR